MNTPLKRIMLFFLLFAFQFAKAQDKNVKYENNIWDPSTISISREDLKSAPKAQTGTFQFFCESKKMQQFFTEETLIKIEKMRDKKETKMVKLSPYTKVRILPYEVIQASYFKPLTDLYVFER